LLGGKTVASSGQQRLQIKCREVSMNKIIQLEVPDESLTQLRELAKDAGLKGISDLINNAVTLYGWAVKQVKAGKDIVALPQDAEGDISRCQRLKHCDQ
jgi:hypothetical protein